MFLVRILSTDEPAFLNRRRRNMIRRPCLPERCFTAQTREPNELGEMNLAHFS